MPTASSVSKISSHATSVSLSYNYILVISSVTQTYTFVVGNCVSRFWIKIPPNSLSTTTTSTNFLPYEKLYRNTAQLLASRSFLVIVFPVTKMQMFLTAMKGQLYANTTFWACFFILFTTSYYRWCYYTSNTS